MFVSSRETDKAEALCSRLLLLFLLLLLLHILEQPGQHSHTKGRDPLQTHYLHDMRRQSCEAIQTYCFFVATPVSNSSLYVDSPDAATDLSPHINPRSRFCSALTLLRLHSTIVALKYKKRPKRTEATLYLRLSGGRSEDLELAGELLST